jgi:signal transduction histidine kinase
MQLFRGRVLRMERLLDDLLAYSRIGRKTDERFAEFMRGDALLDDVLALLAPSPAFEIKVSPAFADVEIQRMPPQQIFHNLIANAIKHHHREDGRVDVTVDDQGDRYASAVIDDGPGIPSEFHDQIIKMFQTLKPRDQVEGSGIGLAVVRKHIEGVGGTLTLDSDEGKGSAFRFTWPKSQTPAKE